MTHRGPFQPPPFCDSVKHIPTCLVSESSLQGNSNPVVDGAEMQLCDELWGRRMPSGDEMQSLFPTE